MWNYPFTLHVRLNADCKIGCQQSHICSFLFMRLVSWLCVICVWLDWIDHWNFMLDYGVIHIWYSHITHKSNVQWISISFVLLYVFECDVYVLKPIMIESKRFFICFCKWFVSPMFFKVFQVDFVWKTCFLSVFATHLASRLCPNLVTSLNGQIIKFFNFEQRLLRLSHECVATWN